MIDDAYYPGLRAAWVVNTGAEPTHPEGSKESHKNRTPLPTNSRQSSVVSSHLSRGLPVFHDGRSRSRLRARSRLPMSASTNGKRERWEEEGYASFRDWRLDERARERRDKNRELVQRQEYLDTTNAEKYSEYF